MSEKITNIDKGTAISIGVVVLLIGGVIWLVNAMNAQSTAIREVDQNVNIMRIEIGNRMERLEEKANVDRWNGTNQKDWAYDLQVQNSELKVPDPRDYIK